MSQSWVCNHGLDMNSFNWARFSMPRGVTCIRHFQRRLHSTLEARANEAIRKSSYSANDRASPGLWRLPTSSILRSLVLGNFFTSPLLYKYGLRLLQKIATSKSKLLNPDHSLPIRAVCKPLIYDHFCAGRDKVEVGETITQVKAIGFSGVILGYGKEVELQERGNSSSAISLSTGEDIESQVFQWKQGNLRTLDMIGSDDFLAIKFTGAGKSITQIMMEGGDAPRSFILAMDEIASSASAKGCRVWIDAEQQVLQRSIDKWTVDLMRKYNRDGRAVIYNTLQAYLKDSKYKLNHMLNTAYAEDWVLGIKLVRGAYINNEIRSRIHDTKEATDMSYNDIALSLIGGGVSGIPTSELPPVALFLAGHNQESVQKALDQVHFLAKGGKLRTVPDFGQLQGMADELGCKLLQDCATLRAELPASFKPPRVYKCLVWGSVQECMQYLVRRAVENHGAAERMRDGMSKLHDELLRRARSIISKSISAW